MDKQRLLKLANIPSTLNEGTVTKTFHFKGKTSTDIDEIDADFSRHGIKSNPDFNNMKVTVTGDENKIKKIVKFHRGIEESVNESDDTTSLKKIHDSVFKFLKTKKGVGEVKELAEFPNRYGDNVSTFSVRYNIEDKYNYDSQGIKIEYSRNVVSIPDKGYFPFKTFNDIKNIINKKSKLKESVNEGKSDLDMVVDTIRKEYENVPIKKLAYHLANKTTYTIDQLLKVLRVYKDMNARDRDKTDLKKLFKSYGLKESLNERYRPNLESKGWEAAQKVIKQLQSSVFRKLDDDELLEFRKAMADAFNLDGVLKEK